MLGILGWVVIGAIAVAALTYFWDDIANWLNNTAADAVGRVLGCNARKNMQRAVVKVSRLRNQMLRNVATVYTKRNAMNSYYDKVTCDATAPVYQFGQKVLDELDKKGELVNTFEYKG